MTSRKMKSRSALICLTIGLALSLAYGLARIQTSSAAMDPAKVIDERRAKMKEIAADAKAINQFVQNGTGDPADVAKKASEISAYGKLIPDWFPPGTGEGDNVGTTHAKMDIWSDPAGFKAAAENMSQLAAKLAEVAASGDKAAIAAQFANLGKNGCGGCHSKFRAPLQ